MKPILTFFLCLVAAAAVAVPPTYHVRLTPSDNLEEAVKNIPPDSAAYLEVTPGTYNVPTNTLTLLRNGLNWYFQPGCRVQFGRIDDSGARSPFKDYTGSASTAVTCNVAGYAEFYFTNSLGGLGSSPIWLSLSNSVVNFECKSIYAAGGGVAVWQTGGTLSLRVRDSIESGGSTIYVESAPPFCTTYVEASKILSGNVAITTRGAQRWGDQVFKADFVRGGITIGDNVHMSLKTIQLSAGSISGIDTNDAAFYGIPVAGTGVISDSVIISQGTPIVNPIDSNYATAFKLRNCTLYGPTNTVTAGYDPILVSTNSYGSPLTIEDCTIICGSPATNWIRAKTSSGGLARIYGRLTVNRTNNANVLMTGHGYTTNSSAVVNN